MRIYKDGGGRWEIFHKPIINQPKQSHQPWQSSTLFLGTDPPDPCKGFEYLYLVGGRPPPPIFCIFVHDFIYFYIFFYVLLYVSFLRLPCSTCQHKFGFWVPPPVGALNPHWIPSLNPFESLHWIPYWIPSLNPFESLHWISSLNPFIASIIASLHSIPLNAFIETIHWVPFIELLQKQQNEPRKAAGPGCRAVM